MKSNTDAMEALFDALADDLKYKLMNGEATAAELNVARQFLKDNNVAIKPGSSNDKLNSIVDSLPFNEDIPLDTSH